MQHGRGCSLEDLARLIQLLTQQADNSPWAKYWSLLSVDNSLCFRIPTEVTAWKGSISKPWKMTMACGGLLLPSWIRWGTTHRVQFVSWLSSCFQDQVKRQPQVKLSTLLILMHAYLMRTIQKCVITPSDEPNLGERFIMEVTYLWETGNTSKSFKTHSWSAGIVFLKCLCLVYKSQEDFKIVPNAQAMQLKFLPVAYLWRRVIGLVRNSAYFPF